MTLRRFGLDRRISEGESTDDDLLVAARARVLISPRRRADLARWWQSVTVAAGLPPARSAMRVSRQEVCRAEREIDELVQTLRSGQPVSARGVAAATLLLTNGYGPVFRRTNPPLDAAVRDVIATLNSFS